MPGEFLTACKFYFSAGDITDKFIKEISGLGIENTPAQEVHGSSKQGKLSRQATPTVVKFTNITIKVIATDDIDLYKWYQDCNEDMGDPRKWSDNRKEGSVVAYDQKGEEKARWDIKFCYPCKYTGPTLTASGGDMANETIELVHEGIKRVK
ncbi:phage tail protein [Dulcicalothrix desertica PCC 7102]|uniref:Phage tail protein n=1 Tax=Dulcicalothrix desertica PCC 7102 TaxID=232991 RepID=A0A3S1CRM0_9CYAN|nr:phage tail protein [Dulcicalothrix desertica]RUT08135.1 phage tail protein [Dulcicalothrix desertica PCC 7102]TWH40004.1 phage tail-like protein [Dulcicalothrix desertica PCC 7102]